MPVRTSFATHPSRASRSDGSDARARLLHAALKLFAEQGYARTSTRSIARAAGANVAAISYYFGDKAGLYAATFNEPMGGNAADLTRLLDPSSGATLSDALRAFLGAYVAPLKHGEIVRQCVRLHMREAIEPTTLWAEEVERDIRGPHEALVGLLCRHLSLARADDDVHRLALAIGGLAMQLFVMQDIVDTLRPALLRSAAGIDAWAERLHLYAMAMVEAETSRRLALAHPSASASRRPVNTNPS
jgi:AcrR family transcriptional regulator